MRILKHIFLPPVYLASTILIVSCSKFPFEEIASPQGARGGATRDTAKIIQPPRPTPEDFPSTIGSQWVYSIYDSLGNSKDTAVVTIIGRFNYPSYRYVSKIQIKYRDHTDTTAVGYAHDTVISGWGNYMWYIFPLVVGNSWGYDYKLERDTTTVIAKTSAIVLAGYFRNVYLVREKYFQVGPVAYHTSTAWFVPRVGIIKLSKSNYGGSNYDKVFSWELISYHIRT